MRDIKLGHCKFYLCWIWSVVYVILRYIFEIIIWLSESCFYVNEYVESWKMSDTFYFFIGWWYRTKTFLKPFRFQDQF